MSAKERCLATLFREFCGLKAGLRHAVIAPASWTEDVRRIIRALDSRPSPLFFSIPGENPVDAVILSTDYEFIGEVGATLFWEGEILAVETNRMLGQMCGFPDCCITSFERDEHIGRAFERYKEQCEGYDPYDLELFEDEEGWVWVFANEPISHIPCSPGCVRTMELAVRYTDMCLTCENKTCKSFHVGRV